MKTFEFSREGLRQCAEYKDYIGMTKEAIEDHPELLPVALGIGLLAATLIVAPAASMVAYKTSIYDSGIVAFKYLIP